MTEPGREWVSAHLYFHGDLDDVVAGVVEPVARALGRPAFFLRHWEGGPHVRLRVRARGAAAAATRAAIRDRAEDWFRRHPSAARVDAAAYRRTREWALRREPWTDPATGLRPNNSVAFVPYRPEPERYGPDLAAVERHFVESSDLARAAVTARMPSGERDLLAFCGLIAAWTHGYAEGGRLVAWIAAGGPGLATSGVPEPAGGRYRDYPDGVRGALRGLARLTLDAADRPPGPTLRGRWEASVRALAAARPDGGIVLGDTCAHLLCNRLGLSPAREAAIRALAADATLDALAGPVRS
jgi:hypothetical protein